MPKQQRRMVGLGLTESHYAAIGLVAANWAALEAIVTSAIWQIGEITRRNRGLRNLSNLHF